MGTLPSIVHETDRLTLRALRAEDEAAFVRLVSESVEAWRPWVPAGPPDTTAEDQFRRELDRSVRGARAGTHLRLAAFEQSGGDGGTDLRTADQADPACRILHHPDKGAASLGVGGMGIAKVAGDAGLAGHAWMLRAARGLGSNHAAIP